MVSVLIANKRTSCGTGSARAIRRSGEIPAVIYGFGKNEQISINSKDFYKEVVLGNLYSRIFEISYGKTKVKVLPREVQFHPVTDAPIHADFQIVDDKVPIKVSVAIKILNKNLCPGIKRGGTLSLVKKTVLLNSMPSSIPSFISVDVGSLNIGDNIHIEDIKLPEGSASLEQKGSTILSISGKEEEKEEEEKSDDSAG